MGRAPVESGVDLALVGRAEDHLADRPGVVVDVADAGAQTLVVEGRGASQTDLLLGREEQLHPAVRPVLSDDPPRCLEHRRHRRLVVGAEDRPPAVPDEAVVDDRLERAFRRHGVEVRTEEDRSPFGGGLDPAEQVADRGTDLGPCVVLVHR